MRLLQGARWLELSSLELQADFLTSRLCLHRDFSARRCVFYANSHQDTALLRGDGEVMRQVCKLHHASLLLTMLPFSLTYLAHFLHPTPQCQNSAQCARLCSEGNLSRGIPFTYSFSVSLRL